MSDTVTNQLILERLEDVQSKIAQMMKDMADIRADNRAHRSLTAGLVQSEHLHGDQIAALQARLERRLELSD